VAFGQKYADQAKKRVLGKSERLLTIEVNNGTIFERTTGKVGGKITSHKIGIRSISK
jgi:hypothetical protein